MESATTKAAAKLWAFLKPVLWVAVLALAMWALRKEWSSFRVRDLNAAVSRIGWLDLGLALLLTVASLLCNASLDLLALRWVGRKLRVARVLGTALVAGAFSMSGGGTVFGGGTIRLRFYGQAGLSGVEVAQITGFLLVAGWLGHAVLAGFLLCVAPPELPWLPIPVARAAGAVLLLSCGSLVCLSIVGARFRWLRRLPPTRILVCSMVVATADWLFAGLALRVLLPDNVPTIPMLAATAIGQALGAASHVPGGAGVVELSISHLAGNVVPLPTMAGALLTYRVVYYLIPFALAIASVGVREAWRKRHWAKRTADSTARVWAVIAPRLAGMTALAGGFVLMLSATTPMESGRREILRALVPLPFVEASHFLSSIAGTVMIVVAGGLLRRVRTAWWIAVIMAASGVVFSLLKGFDYEEAIVLSVFLAALLPFRSRFHRHAALWTRRFSLQWWALIGSMIGLTLWFGFYTSRHVGYEYDLWWRYSFENDASRLLRGMLGSGVIIMAVALAQWLRPAPARHAEPAPDMTKIAAMVATARRSSAALALLGDKQFLFSCDGDAFLMYGQQGRTRVALGDPVGEAESCEELLWRFLEKCQDEGMRAVFYQLSTQMIPACVEMGLRVYKLGEEAHVRLATFDLSGAGMKKLRKSVNRMEREGWSFDIWPPEQVRERLAELRAVSDDWLAQHRVREKGFSLGRFDGDYLSRFPVAVIRVDGKVVAFANIWPGNGRDEFSIDLMRHVRDAPNGVMDCLLVRLMMWGRDCGYKRFDLGMAPLSGLDARQFASLWNRVGGLVYDHGEAFYNFNGLRAWKEKFDPEWEPKYIGLHKPWELPAAIFDLTNLIGRGPAKKKKGHSGRSAAGPAADVTPTPDEKQSGASIPPSHQVDGDAA